jgi:uncharacterized DUF497 family protein
MPLNFQWDENKARTNLAKHGVSFEEATTVFGDPVSLTIPDPAHSQVEDRLIILGHSKATQGPGRQVSLPSTVYRARTRISFNSAGSSAIGLPFMLLLAAAFSQSTGTASGVTP